MSLELEQLANQAIGAALEVHKALGPGFLEAVYEDALAIELELRGIIFVRQAPVSVTYKGQKVGEGRLDILVDQKLILELKSVESLTAVHTAQLMSYLKATKLHLGLLINFNVPLLRDGLKRIVL